MAKKYRKGLKDYPGSTLFIVILSAVLLSVLCFWVIFNLKIETIILPDKVKTVKEIKDSPLKIPSVGIDVIAIPADGSQESVDKALEIAASSEDYFVPQQFQNPANPQMHYRTTGPELVSQLGKKIDIYVSGIGSGGTLQGVAQYLLEQNPDCKIVAVEPKNVSALLGDEPGLHQIQGIGDGFIPDILDTSIITDIVEVTDDDAINTARELARVQGLLVGTSSGANV